MNAMISTVARATAPSPLPLHDQPVKAEQILAAATRLLPMLERGEPVSSSALREAMTASFGGSDAEGLWLWKDAYEACEAAQVLFLRKFGTAIAARAHAPRAALAMIGKVAGLLPTHTRRSPESQALQQFSTPLPLSFVAARAAGFLADDRVLEPSAGTGLMAIFAELAHARLILNEIAPARASLLEGLFPTVAITRHDAADIDDYLEATIRPTAVLMNPPFSAGVHVEGRAADAAWRHLASAFARLAPGGRLVAITGANLSPDNPKWRDAFVRLQAKGELLFTAAIDGKAYARHGTTTETRLTVIDKIPARDSSRLVASRGVAPDVETLLDWIMGLPPRSPSTAANSIGALSSGIVRAVAAKMAARRSSETLRPAGIIVPATRPARKPTVASAPSTADMGEQIELAYDLREAAPKNTARQSDGVYEPYALQSIVIPDAKPHPDTLVESAAMASVAPPKPTYRPHLPARVVTDGHLSAPQLESVIYAGEAHAGHLAGFWTVDVSFDNLKAAADGTHGAFRLRRGWYLGDGTGAGKGRQVGGIILDNWLKGRRKALWVSKSDTLIEDAQRDWSALGQEKLLVTPLSRYRQGQPITLTEGILFTTFATLRVDEHDGKRSRVQQIVDWLGRDFDGVVVFDEGHAMANAAGGKSDRGDREASQQGKAGLRLQRALPDARVVYVSATAATDVEQLAYAERLGLWGSDVFPFATRSEFVAAIEDGGVSAMEVLARDLKAMGLYASCSLSFEGVEYEIVEHALTDEQTRIYDAWASAFQVIHNHLDAALRAAGITSENGTLNRQAKSAARSAFESSKQRFFNHLLTAMKVPTLIRRIEEDLNAGHAAIIQIVSTGEALLERRLAEIPIEDWGDIQVDVTPRELVLDYLQHSFPVQLFEEITDKEGNKSSRAVHDADGNPVLCREAMRRRDDLVERLASLPAVPTALDQIVQHFGVDSVAEITGRSRRIVPVTDQGAIRRFAVQSRPGSANLDETRVFMDDRKQILIFSEAGGTGRSYHADRTAKNGRLRVHYLLEAGWRADVAIQGLGRSHRTNQRQPPVFRPIASDVKAERRFLSTIARRLDTLGAITRGQRQTGGQGMFRSEDNLESQYARDALRQFYGLVYAGRVEGCSLQTFEAVTGLELTSREGGLRDELPPIHTFLNRMLALTIDMQNRLFGAFEQLLAARVEGALRAGIYDIGIETLRADSMRVTDRRLIHTHPSTGAETHLLTIEERRRNRPMTIDMVLDLLAKDAGAKRMVNTKSGRAAIMTPSRSIMRDDGAVEPCVLLLRPMDRMHFEMRQLAETNWEEADELSFAAAWSAEIDAMPEFTVSTLHMISGLLLPIWKRLPSGYSRVYRLETDEGERVLGRLIAAADLSRLCQTFGLDGLRQIDMTEAWGMVTASASILALEGGMALRRVRVMNDFRIELTGFSDGIRDWLRAIGLFAEMIQWRLRFFVPLSDEGPAVLGRLLERHPVIDISTRT